MAMRTIVMALCILAWSAATAQKIDAASHRCVAAALQEHVREHPSAFPFEALSGGTQDFADGDSVSVAFRRIELTRSVDPLRGSGEK
jgi:hypothetical protein